MSYEYMFLVLQNRHLNTILETIVVFKYEYCYCRDLFNSI